MLLHSVSRWYSILLLLVRTAARGTTHVLYSAPTANEVMRFRKTRVYLVASFLVFWWRQITLLWWWRSWRCVVVGRGVCWNLAQNMRVDSVIINNAQTCIHTKYTVHFVRAILAGQLPGIL